MWLVVGSVLTLVGLVGLWLHYFYRSAQQREERRRQHKGKYASVPLSEPKSRGGAPALAISLVNPPFGDEHKFTLFWLHGLGDTADGWRDGAASFQLRCTRVVLPTAPVRPVTINGGIAMNAWFDIAGLTIGAREDVAGIEEACKALAALVRKEIAGGIPASRIAVGGFSQGGAVALHTVYVEGFLDIQIGAVVALSAWLPRGAKILRGGRNVPKMSRVNASTAIFMGHGKHDPMVQVQFGELSAKILKDGGAPTTWKTYACQHTTCASEMSDVGKFLGEQLK